MRIAARFLLSILLPLVGVGCGVVKQPSVDPSHAKASMAHTPMPALCAGCHERNMPKATQQIPKNSAKKANLFFHQPNLIAGQDCVACHSDPAKAGVSFSGAKFKHLITAITGCVECHQDNMPAGTKMVPKDAKKISRVFYHREELIGTQDCIACHTDPAKAGVSFAGAKFKHLPTAITQCAACHSDDMPAATAAEPAPSKRDPNPNQNNLFFHSPQLMNGADCIHCHAENMGKNWSAAKYSHLDAGGKLIASCKDCHTQLALSRHKGKNTNLTETHPDCNSCHNQSAVKTDNQADMNWRLDPSHERGKR